MRQTKTGKMVELFFEYPGRKFTVREIAKLTKMPRATVHKRLVELKRQNLITKDNEAVNDLVFKTKKINYFVERVVDSGLIGMLIDELNPSCIILFGSVQKGDSVKDSDIDLFVESSVRRVVELGKFEKRLGHKIQLFVEGDINRLHSNLFNNVVNGIKLFGSFKIK